MGYEFSGKYRSIELGELKNRLADAGFAVRLAAPQKLQIDFAATRPHGWSEDALLDVKDGKLHLLIHGGTAAERQRLISYVEATALQSPLEEL